MLLKANPQTLTVTTANFVNNNRKITQNFGGKNRGKVLIYKYKYKNNIKKDIM